MARAGLDPDWSCAFANDFDQRKVDCYASNWGSNEVVCGDIGKLKVQELPGQADLVWASFPCQDLSLAGGGAGLRGNRSGTFWPFWSLMQALIEDDRRPPIVVLENVLGALTSHGGKDFAALCEALAQAEYTVGAVVMDAAKFLPHSRPRLFVIGLHSATEIPASLRLAAPNGEWHTSALVAAHARLSAEAQANWAWWNLPKASGRVQALSEIIGDSPNDVRWHDEAETQKLIDMMAPLHKQKVEAAQRNGKRIVGTLYRRTRRSETGEKVQRAEVRFDQTAGCLRTPAGGSSRQTVIVIDGPKIRTRLISARETARLMGLPDSYELPTRYNEAYHLTGDGVAVPVVRHLSRNLLLPLLGFRTIERLIA